MTERRAMSDPFSSRTGPTRCANAIPSLTVTSPSQDASRTVGCSRLYRPRFDRSSAPGLERQSFPGDQPLAVSQPRQRVVATHGSTLKKMWTRPGPQSNTEVSRPMPRPGGVFVWRTNFSNDDTTPRPDSGSAATTTWLEVCRPPPTIRAPSMARVPSQSRCPGQRADPGREARGGELKVDGSKPLAASTACPGHPNVSRPTSRPGSDAF
jgi:hypothetical protein